MKTANVLALLALAGFGGLAASGASAQSQGVQVFRGGTQPALAVSREAGVQVFRAVAAARAAADHQAARAEPAVETIAAGSRLWLVNRAEGKLTACRLVATTQVGGRRIDCHSGSLPR